MDGILKLAASGAVDIVMPAIAANEQQQGQEIGNFMVFKERIGQLGINPKMYVTLRDKCDSFLRHKCILRDICDIYYPGPDIAPKYIIRTA